MNKLILFTFIFIVILLYYIISDTHRNYKNINIPKKLFIASEQSSNYLSEDIQYKIKILKANNPNYTVEYYDYISCNKFVEHEYPEYFKKYNNLTTFSEKLNFWKLLIIYKYGGIYLNLNHTLLVPLSQINNIKDQFISLTDMKIDILGAYKYHPIIKEIINLHFMIDEEDLIKYGINKFFNNSLVNCLPIGIFAINNHIIKLFNHNNTYIYDINNIKILKINDKSNLPQISIVDNTAKYIPKYIFVTAPFKETKLPSVIYYQLSNIKINNPDYQIHYYDDEQCREFIKINFPDYLNDYDILIPSAYKADLWRYLILYYYGGIYMDIGHLPLVSFEEIIDINDEFISVKDFKNAGIHNAFICVYPRHPLLHKVIDLTINNIRKRNYGLNSLDITGPKVLSRAFNLLINKNENAEIPEGKVKINDMLFKFLYLSADIKNQNNTYIIDLYDRKIIKTKFNNYYKIMYDNFNKPKYTILWYTGKVFANEQ